MGKNLLLKASVLLVVIFFHSFVLTPKIHAGAMGQVIDIAVARQTLRTVAPSVIKVTPAGWGYAIGYMAIAGAAYIFIKSGGVSAIKTWIDHTLDPVYQPPPPWGTYNTWSAATGTWQFRTTQNGPGCTYFQTNSNTGNGWPSGTSWQWMTVNSCASSGDIASFVASHGGSSIPPAPAVPTDYGVPLGTSQPDFPSGSVKFTPGGAALLNGQNPVGTVTSLPDSEIDSMLSALGATEPVAGTQPQPNAGDNTLSSDANASIPWLQQIANYVSNLVGIKTDTGSIKTNTDNMVAGQSTQTTAIQNMSGKMDNIAAALNNQTNQDNAVLEKMDNVAQTTLSLKDALTETSANVETLSTRINSLKTLMSTKFPFSFIQGITVPTVQPGGASLVPDIVLPTGQHWVVDPMQYPVIADFFGVVRSLVSLMMWAVFTLVMIRRVTQI